MNRIFFVLCFLGVLQGTAVAADAPVQSVLLTGEDARAFCLDTWFPRLRIGHEPTATELSEFVGKLLELYTDDVEFVDPNNKDSFGTEVLKGKRQLRRYYEAVLRNYPKWNFTILGIYPTESGFVLRYEGRDAPPVERFEGVDVIELRRDGDSWKIAKLFGYYDRKPFMPVQAAAEGESR